MTLALIGLLKSKKIVNIQYLSPCLNKLMKKRDVITWKKLYNSRISKIPKKYTNIALREIPCLE